MSSAAKILSKKNKPVSSASRVRLTIFRYGLSFVTTAAALGLGLFVSQLGIRHVQYSMFLLAIAVTAWYGGIGPALVATLFSALAHAYFFSVPIYSLAVNADELPHFVVFVAFALLVGSFGAVRRQVENELRASEAMLRERANLLDLTHDTIFVRDMKNVITYWNRGAEELYGFTRHEAVGQTSHSLLQTVFPESLDDIRANLLRNGRWEGELVHTTHDGAKLIVSSRWSLQRDEQGNPIAILETNNDITEQKQAAQALRKLNEELEERVADRTRELQATNRELEAFAYSVSHDLRAPLRHIAGFTELLQRHAEPCMDEKSRRHITMILDSASRMGSLIDDLLEFSRIGRADAQMTVVDLAQITKAVVNDVAPDTQGRKVNWKIGDLPKCEGDPKMLRLVLVNLVSNALKFTRTRDPAEIQIDSLNPNPNEVVVFVKDNGVGFDMKYKDRLFGVFQRLHSPEAFEGTGIGLATVQRIVHRHGGHVWAEGATNNGATFHVALPKLTKA